MMVMAIAAVFAQQLLNSRFLEQALLDEVRIFQRLADEREEIGSEPIRNRKHETLFFTVQDWGRKVVCCEFAHEMLGLAVLYFDDRWNFCQKFDQFVIEKW